MLEARTYDSLTAIGRPRWEACFPDAVEGFDYLLAVEEAGLAGFAWRYVLVEDAGRPLAAAPGFITDYALDTTLTPLGRRAIAAVRRLAPRAFTVRLGALGSPLTESVGLGFAPEVPAAARPAVLGALLEAFRAETLAAGCGLAALKDTPDPDAELWAAAARPLGFRPVGGLPIAYLDIDFPDIETYLARLSPGARKDMRRKLRSLGRLTIEVREDLDGLADQVLALYADTRARADLQFEELTEAYFTGVLAHMRGRAICVLYRADGELLATNLLLHDGATLLDKFFCMDGIRGRDHNLYFISWFTNLRLCLERGFKRYQSGQAGYANKLRLGSSVIRTTMHFRHRSPLINQALRLAAPLLSEDFLPEVA